MQIGIRWPQESEIPSSVPSVLHSLIRSVEKDALSSELWTLTWLEGKPICALGHEVSVTLNHAGEPIVVTGLEEEEDVDDWLSN